MAAKDNLKTGGEILVECLRVNGIDRVFCVPGESYLAALDAFHDVPEIQLVVCRHEGAAAMMAEAHAQLTGRPGICFVTRGPGATNASGGIHIAHQDSTPVILFIGQVARDYLEREAFQEIDYRRMFGEMSKWTGQIDDEARVAEYVSHAIHLSQAGRQGPVVLVLPEDMLCARTAPATLAPAAKVQAHPGPENLSQLQEMLKKSKKPMVIIGGGGWDEAACENFRTWAEACNLPVAVTFRCQDKFDNLHACYAGDLGVAPNPKLAARVKESDLLVVVGARMGEMTTSGYTLIDIPTPSQTLVHVYPGNQDYRQERSDHVQASLSESPSVEKRLSDTRRWQSSRPARAPRRRCRCKSQGRTSLHALRLSISCVHREAKWCSGRNGRSTMQDPHRKTMARRDFDWPGRRLRVTG